MNNPRKSLSGRYRWYNDTLFTSIADQHNIDVDPGLDPVCHFDADPHLDPTFHFDADPDPGPDPSLKTKAQNLEKVLQ